MFRGGTATARPLVYCETSNTPYQFFSPDGLARPEPKENSCLTLGSMPPAVPRNWIAKNLLIIDLIGPLREAHVELCQEFPLGF
jgi:hypothetical protein